MAPVIAMVASSGTSLTVIAAALITASVAAGVGVAGWLQKLWADRRQQWWTRVSWAIEKALSHDIESRVVGLTALTALGTSKLASKDDRELLRKIAKEVIAQWRKSQ